MTRFQKALKALRDYVDKRENGSSDEVRRKRLNLVLAVERAHLDDLEARKQLTIGE